MKKFKEFLKFSQEPTIKNKDVVSQIQPQTQYYMVVSGVSGSVYPIGNLLSGEFDDVFVNEKNDTVPAFSFNKYFAYKTQKAAVDNSVGLGTKPNSVYILELGYSEDEVRVAAAMGKFSQTILRATPRDQLTTKDAIPTPIENPHFNDNLWENKSQTNLNKKS